MKRLAALLLSPLLVLGGCTVVTDPDQETVTAQAGAVSEGFSARGTSGRLILRNRSTVQVHYVAVEEQTAQRFDLNPDFAKWPSVAPGAEVRIPYAEIAGYQPGAQRAMVHWRTTGQSGYLRVDLN